MALLIESEKLLFIMVPGTGCSAAGSALSSHFDVKNIPSVGIYDGTKRVHGAKHNSVDELLRDRIIEIDFLKGVTVFATIRNPFDRIVSKYMTQVSDWSMTYLKAQRDNQAWRDSFPGDADVFINKALRRAEFKKRLFKWMGFNFWLYLELGKRLVMQARRTNLSELGFPMLEKVNYVIKFECLEQGMNELLKELGSTLKIEIPIKNKTPDKQVYTQYYNFFSIWIINLMFKADLKRFGYSFHGSIDSRSLIKMN